MKPIHLAVGNINIDVYLYVDRLPAPDEELPVTDAAIGPGGAASNYAVAVALAGHHVKLLAHTTRHAVSMGILDSLKSKGVDTSTVIVHDKGIPGIVIVLVTRGGETSMLKVRGVNSLLRGDEVKGEFNVVHVASTPVTVAERLLENVRTDIFSYDPGGAIALRDPGGVRRLAEKVTILTLNRREYLHVYGENLDPDGMPDILLVRLGSRGAIALTEDAAFYVKPCKLGEPVDTTGAGDVFNAYMNVMLAEGRGLEEALEVASVAAGLKVLRRGAQSIPTREEVMRARARCTGLVEKVSLAEACRIITRFAGD